MTEEALSTLAVPRRGGRPTKQEAEQKRGQILDVAAALFLTQGYGATSIDAVAQGAGISKRTFYDRFKDKADLFGAVIHHIVGRMRPDDMSPLFAGGSFEEILRRLAGLALQAALTPQAVALQRVLLAEAARFPELAVVASGEGTRGEALVRIAALLERERAAGRLSLNKAEFAAEQFLQMVISLPLRRAMGLGTPMTSVELDVWADDAVNLFLNGCRGWR